MVDFPPCKINLGLQITAKRADGYHDLVTCFYPVPWFDILEIISSKQFVYSSSGLPIPDNGKKNLCVRAYELLKADFGIPPVAIHLHKIIPMGAGLGGGSSDAAWTLRMLDHICQLNLSSSDLENYASRLGSDCAFFLHDKPMLGTGRGEVLEEISVNLKGKYIALVKPDVHVSTAEAYAGVTPRQPEIDLKKTLEENPVKSWQQVVSNDFEESVFKKHPAIANQKKLLYKAGALYASMSGSGSAVFGIFDVEPVLKEKFSGMLYWSGKL